MRRSPAHRPRDGARGNVRIIGGQFRRRRITFSDAAGLRPTPDRVRETLFNWLGVRVDGARCLDLFAGSGALGLEAASRGAAEVVLVERDREVAACLGQQVALLGAAGVSVEQADALDWLQGVSRPFDLVFLDPPFDAPLLAPATAALESGGWLAPEALIYVERRRGEPMPALPPPWRPLRDDEAGQVRYHLLQRDSG